MVSPTGSTGWRSAVRSQFTVPAQEPEKPKATRGEWMEGVLKILSGDRLPDLQMRALADVITADNAGIVPDNFSSELIGIIDARRPFMDSTRRLATPSSGMRLTVPVITQRPTVALQSEEKAELSSTTTKIDTVDFDVVTKGGAGDLSLQILKRADRSFLDLYLQLLAEAYAIEAETEAVESLLGADVDDGNTLDPENLLLGSAFTTAFDVIRRPPDTMWVSSEAIAAFIDAKSQHLQLAAVPRPGGLGNGRRRDLGHHQRTPGRSRPGAERCRCRRDRRSVERIRLGRGWDVHPPGGRAVSGWT